MPWKQKSQLTCAMQSEWNRNSLVISRIETGIGLRKLDQIGGYRTHLVDKRYGGM